MNYTTIQKIIRKHYGKRRTKNLNWEKCGEEIEAFVRAQEKKIEAKKLSYHSEVGKKKAIRKVIEDEYESYFKVMGGYVWIHGNSKLKKLVKDLKRN